MKRDHEACLAHNRAILQDLVVNKKSTKGLTPRGEEWLISMVGTFLKGLTVPVELVNSGHIARFLAPYADRPFQKHGFYRALKSFYRWLRRQRLIAENPFDYLDAPKLPDKVLNTITPEQAATLIANARCIRDKAIIAIFADTGGRRSEVCNICFSDVDLKHNRIKVLGKGNNEGYLVFGDATKALLVAHIALNKPADRLFDLNYEGVKMMLNRLGARCGIQARPHDFRRGFATTLRYLGVGDLDIQQLGRWKSLEMVRRYTKAFTFEDAARRYKPIVG